MATAWNSRREGQLINERIDQAFTSRYRNQYWISIVAFSPINGYNLFFNTRRPGEFTRSRPIARLTNSSFKELVDILRVVRTKYQFTFHYIGFNRQERRILYEEVK